jgi:CRISPR-associated protein Csb2
LPRQTNLRAETWCQAASTWSTVTPIALDRHPGDLASRNAAKRERALSEARATIQAACERIALPAPTVIELLPAAPWIGSQKAREFGAFSNGANPRVLTHARLGFASPVAGPVLLGAGRYLGLGLLRPEVQDA